eukprot:TRINITY_DN1299_c0_g1_i1.p2 TRINITY_DN1299_c0_g1~~TRINITY_DN1299_c0_g1_i1.p2  ORF type:complete len:322 (+),score=72.12 TRINITY_DN1299_c0_g1_i1:353-1318(+)
MSSATPSSAPATPAASAQISSVTGAILGTRLPLSATDCDARDVADFVLAAAPGTSVTLAIVFTQAPPSAPSTSVLLESWNLSAHALFPTATDAAITLRVLHSTLRLLPAFRLAAALKKATPAVPSVISFSVSAGQPRLPFLPSTPLSSTVLAPGLAVTHLADVSFLLATLQAPVAAQNPAIAVPRSAPRAIAPAQRPAAPRPIQPETYVPSNEILDRSRSAPVSAPESPLQFALSFAPVPRARSCLESALLALETKSAALSSPPPAVATASKPDSDDLDDLDSGSDDTMLFDMDDASSTSCSPAAAVARSWDFPAATPLSP